jgi:BirA family transcriptional regulator, biotin operon repressor / biotin---[acetyl-CoA-carboxylase] ligase
VPSPGWLGRCVGWALTCPTLVPVNDVSPRAALGHDRLAAAAGEPWRVALYAAAESTNALAAAATEPHLVVVADHQTAGRGRLGRDWVTPPGAALTFSAVVDPGLADEWWPLVPLAAGYAVARAVDGSLKWPNDVLLDGAKVCGILVERVQRSPEMAPLAVVGIGINVDQTRAELPVETATSLALASGPVDRAELLGEVLRELGSALGTASRSPQSLVSAYRARCDTLGRDVRVDLPGGGTLEGQAVDVEGHGRLVVRTPSGERVAVAAGDVVHVRARE